MKIRRIRIAFLIPKATNRNSQYSVFVVFSNNGFKMKMKPIGCPETSVTKFHRTLRHSPEEYSSHVVRGGSLKSRMACLVNEMHCVYCAVRTECLNIIQDLIRLHSCTQSSSYRLFLCACSINLRITVLRTIANCHWMRRKYKHIARIF